ncbi:MAG: hypothetical protein ABIJ30_08460 [bacterium]
MDNWFLFSNGIRRNSLFYYSRKGGLIMEAIYIILGGLIVICLPLAVYFAYQDRKEAKLSSP